MRLPVIIYFLWIGFAFASDWYVATNGTGFGTNGWADATNNLQGAITACASNYTVWVSNGTYNPANLTVGGGVTVRSRTGRPVDVILNGNAAGRVVTNAPSSWLIGCTVTNGNTDYGAGVYSGSISNCMVINNTATQRGGGGYGGSIFYNCTIGWNNATRFGGGGSGSVIFYSCTIVGNWANEYGGGGHDCTFYNCLILANRTGDNGASFGYSAGGHGCTFYNCTLSSNIAFVSAGMAASKAYNCISWGNRNADDFSGTAGSPTNQYSCGAGYAGLGSITNDPLFVSTNVLHLQINSPCVNKGSNYSWTTSAGAVDYDGNPRIRYGTVDMGCYETIRDGTIYVIH